VCDRIPVHRQRDVVNQLDDQLGQPIRGRSLSGEEERARRDVDLGVAPQPVIEHDDVNHVEQLALVLVNPLDLAVEDGAGIDDVPGRAPQPVREAELGVALRAPETIADAGVAGRDGGVQLTRVPIHRHRALRNQCGQQRVATAASASAQRSSCC
jgi:hypothetical protein